MIIAKSLKPDSNGIVKNIFDKNIGLIHEKIKTFENNIGKNW